MIFSLDAFYVRMQQLLRTNRAFRYWWQFWSNYSFVFFAVAAMYLLFIDANAIRIGITAIVSFLFARLGVVSMINVFVHRERPYQRYDFAPITSRFFSGRTKIHNSFPSRHASALAAVAMVVVILVPPVGLVILLVTLFTGIARVVLGYHYPTDILAGIIIGCITAYCSVYLTQNLW